jgi:hypothetical protein
MYTRGNKNLPPCTCQWPARRYSCYHNFAVYFHHDIIDCSPSHAFRTKSVCAIIYMYVKKFFSLLETVREANKVINNFRGGREVYKVDLFVFL